MIAADTSTWVAFLDGGRGQDVQLLDRALEDRQVLMVPVVLTELLSDPKLPADVAKTLSEVPLIEVEGISLITRDRDFRALTEIARLDCLPV